MSQSAPEPHNIQRIKLRENIAFYFNEGELRSLCFDLGVDYDDLPGPAKADKARELVSYFERRGRVNDLIKRCRELRPNVDWGPRWESPWRRIAKIVGVGVALVAVVVIARSLIPYREPNPSPKHMPSPTLTAVVVVDTMDNLDGWRTFVDAAGSAINISSTSGVSGDAIQMDFDLEQGGFVGMSKMIAPGILSGTQRIRFGYKGAGQTNTLELKLFYQPDANGSGEIFSYSQREIAGTDPWVTFEQFYSAFDCGTTCRTPGQQLDPLRVWKLEIAVSHQLGGTRGLGRVVLDQIEALR